MSFSERRARAEHYLGLFSRSELSQQAFCAEHGLSVGTFQYWLRRSRQGADSPFLSVSISEVPCVGGCHLTTRQGTRITLPSGWPATQIAALVHQLESC